jgi:hypothetical protein
VQACSHERVVLGRVCIYFVSSRTRRPFCALSSWGSFGLLRLHDRIALLPTECMPRTVDKNCRKLFPSFAPSEISAVIFVLFSPQIICGTRSAQ